jgi:hypothetical protein
LIYRRSNPRNRATSTSVVQNPAQIPARPATRRPVLDPMVASMPPTPSFASQPRISFSQPVASSYHPMAGSSSCHPSYYAYPMFPSKNFGGPLVPRTPVNCGPNQAMMTPSIINPYAKKHDQGFPGQPSSSSSPQHHPAAYHPARRYPLGDLGGTGGQVPSYPPPQLPFQHGRARYSNRLDSPAASQFSPNRSPPMVDHHPPLTLPSFSSSSSSSGSSSPIDLQAAWSKTPDAVHDENHAQHRSGLLSSLAQTEPDDPSSSSTDERSDAGTTTFGTTTPCGETTTRGTTVSTRRGTTSRGGDTTSAVTTSIAEPAAASPPPAAASSEHHSYNATYGLLCFCDVSRKYRL